VTAVSIIITTKNRAESLSHTLGALAKLKIPAAYSAEVLVVDNGSTDSTRSLIETARVDGLPIRYLYEGRAGKSRAVNLALEQSYGDLLLFTDDDARPPADWVQRMCRPIIEGTADAVVGGVRLAPHLERPWMKGEVRGWIACTDGLIDPQRPRLVGANMALSRRVLEQIPGLDPELGPGALGFFDDTLLGDQVLKAGFRIAVALDVVVEHHLDVDRLGEAQLLELAQRLGRSSAYQYHHWEHGDIRLKWAKILYLGAIRQWRRLRSVRDPGTLPHLLNIEFKLALVRHFMIERRRPRNYEKWGLVKKGMRPARDPGSAKPLVHA
jgi:GT2 family glycosyltransferase